MKLHFDTTQTNSIRVSLDDGGPIDTIQKENHFGSQVLLLAVNEILAKQHKVLKDLDGVRVQEGPGSYTGTRVGVAVANAFAYGLKIPINDLPIGNYAKPKYT